jgi:predicted tellurium resistance membrane protein TerC
MEAIAALIALTAMEIVLGIDNVVFIAIVASKLPAEKQLRARLFGLAIALLLRLGLLFTLKWLMGLTKPFATIAGVPLSGKSIILLLGGLFLIGKSTHEIRSKLEGTVKEREIKAMPSSAWVIAQVAMIDLVFAVDSVITAIGMARQLWVMVTAMVIAMMVMLVSAGVVSNFINRHPSLKILALSFLILIGVMLVVEGLGKHFDRGYIYFAMGFSLAVELLEMRLQEKPQPVNLREPKPPSSA